jgi:hypothetical protein
MLGRCLFLCRNRFLKNVCWNFKLVPSVSVPETQITVEFPIVIFRFETEEPKKFVQDANRIGTLTAFHVCTGITVSSGLATISG